MAGHKEAAVQFDGVTKRFGDVMALDQVSLDIGRGEFMTLLGPSGCGKTTLLRLAACFLGPDAGSIAIDESDETRSPGSSTRSQIGNTAGWTGTCSKSGPWASRL